MYGDIYCTDFTLACEQAFSRAGWGEGKTLSLPFSRYFSPNREPVHRLTLLSLVISSLLFLLGF